MLPDVMSHLSRLVSFDTCNPPRRIGAADGVVEYVAGVLRGAGFGVEVTDLDQGRVNVLATRGSAGVLVDCHLDTVPIGEGWSGDPFSLRVEHGRAIARGACDVKGAGACILAACEATRGDASVLFSTDEEAGTSHCVRTFVEGLDQEPELAIVSEPTGCRVVNRHRGILSAMLEFEGDGGHASMALGSRRSALHDAVAWGAAALDHPLARESRFNIGVIEGGTKANVVADRARVTFGARPEGGVEPATLLETLLTLIPEGARARASTRFVAAGLSNEPDHPALRALGPRAGEGVDFWTEAALFAQGGIPAVVFGPGDIAQAHAPDEFVTTDQLEQAALAYARLFAT